MSRGTGAIMAAPEQREHGFTSVQYVVSVAMSLGVLVMLVNLIVFQYGRGVVQAAAEEGARAGAPLGASVANCDVRARQMLDAGLARSMREGAVIRCEPEGDWIVAHGSARFRSWVPMIPDWHFEVSARSLRQDMIGNG